jgi:hypothetical protein
MFIQYIFLFSFVYYWTITTPYTYVFKLPKHEIFDGVFVAYIKPN